MNADAYASTGQGIIGTNMFAYCANCPTISCDPLGLWTISISVTFAGVLGIGISVSIGLAIDDDGNTDVQYSYSIPGIDDTVTVGGVSAGIGIAAQYTTADTVTLQPTWAQVWGPGGTLVQTSYRFPMPVTLI